MAGDFPGGPVARTPSSQCRGPGFNPWSGNWIPHAATKDLACKQAKTSNAAMKIAATKTEDLACHQPLRLTQPNKNKW